MNINDIPRKATDLNALRVFATVADTASFSAAAKRLGLPKWSVSRSISALESAMGVPLLHRTTRRVTLSPAGLALHARVAPLLSSLDVATKVWLEDSGEPAGEVHITIPNFFHTPLIGSALAKFAARYPGVQVDVHFSGAVADFAIEGFDLALLVGPGRMKDTSLVARRGWQIFGSFFAAPEYLAERGIPCSLTELATHDIVAFRDLPSVLLEGPRGPVTFKIQSRIRSNDVLFMREAIRSGAGVGILPTFLAESDIAAGRLVPVLARYVCPDAFVYIIRPSTREVPLRVKVLSDFLFEYMKTTPLVASLE